MTSKLADCGSSGSVPRAILQITLEPQDELSPKDQALARPWQVISCIAMGCVEQVSGRATDRLTSAFAEVTVTILVRTSRQGNRLCCPSSLVQPLNKYTNVLPCPGGRQASHSAGVSLRQSSPYMARYRPALLASRDTRPPRPAGVCFVSSQLAHRLAVSHTGSAKIERHPRAIAYTMAIEQPVSSQASDLVRRLPSAAEQQCHLSNSSAVRQASQSDLGRIC